jgi:hypothetical protein
MEVIIKSFGIDNETGLEKQATFSSLRIDVLNEVIEVYIDINLVYPSGKKQRIKTIVYRRFNAEGNMKFNAFKESAIGQGIISIIQNDFNAIQSFKTIEQDLAQV